eukprot:COSAG01_NODE_1280_length_10925_cov_23.969333_2_plen_49_part_00
MTTAAAKFVSFGSPLQQAVPPKIVGGATAALENDVITRITDHIVDRSI